MQGELIIGDDNAHLYKDIVPEDMSKGRTPRDYAKVPYGQLAVGGGGFAAKFDLLIPPRSEWSARIKKMEAEKTRISDLLLQAKIPSLDQNGTNYCWCNAVITAIQAIRCKAGEKYVKLSPASVAAPIKNYANQGGWGGEALEYIVEHGVGAASLWPPNARDRKYMTDELKENALRHRVTEWYDLRPRSFDEVMACLLYGIPVAIGLNWWGHEVCACDPVEISPGKFGARIRNSWGDGYGEKGFAVLTESKATPDDACAPRVSLPSNS